MILVGPHEGGEEIVARPVDEASERAAMISVRRFIPPMPASQAPL